MSKIEAADAFAYDQARSAVLSEYLKPVLGSLLALDTFSQSDRIDPPLSADLQVRVEKYSNVIEVDDFGFIGAKAEFDEYEARILLADVIKHEDLYS